MVVLSRKNVDIELLYYVNSNYCTHLRYVFGQNLLILYKHQIKANVVVHLVKIKP